MTLTFTRSGGLVGAPGLRVHGTVEIAPGQGLVTSADGYRRPLGDQEAAGLRQDGEAALASGTLAMSGESGGADAFRFRLMIADETRSLTIESGATIPGA